MSEPTTQQLAALGPPGRICLVVTRSDGVETLTLGARQVYRIGRDVDSDVKLADASVSRQHAEIHAGPPLSVQDLGSRNGTKINGSRLEPYARHELHPGMVVTFGDVVALVRPAETAEQPQEPLSRRGRAASLPKSVALASPAMLELYELIEIIGPSKLNVLILGETGVGKDVYAELVHQASDRHAKPFLRINCAALPENLLEAELFGYEKGAFTGAVVAKAGLFESAEGGTVFLDEIGDMPLVTQAKLLRVLESGDVMRIGSLKPKRVDIRFLAATHRELEKLSAEGAFRMDLYFRLNGVSVTLPPLRRRPEDVEALVALFVSSAGARHGPLTDAAKAKLSLHTWPGNVRELKNVVERAALLSRGGVIDAHHVSFGSTSLAEPPAAPREPDAPRASPGHMHAAMAELERQRISEAMKACAGNQTMAAEMLGISRGTLIKRLKAYGYARPLKDRKG